MPERREKRDAARAAKRTRQDAAHTAAQAAALQRVAALVESGHLSRMSQDPYDLEALAQLHLDAWREWMQLGEDDVLSDGSARLIRYFGTEPTWTNRVEALLSANDPDQGDTHD